jgi:crotonobetainyl-CoA:carnitine CoA-transferase CaiB-like acyl-CoA transferase
VRAPIRLDGVDAHGDRAAPRLGEHTEEVLAELGFSRGEIAELKGKGVAG